MSYLDELNEAQKKAVVKIDGPIMVIAGAGSGKTRVLTYRIIHMIENNIDPFNILALTFTNKAAREMKDRISSKIGQSEARNIWMGTFHSVFARILRSEAKLLGYPSNFTIYDTDDSKSLIKRIIKELNLDDKVYKPNLVLSRISSAKNNLISASNYANNAVIQQEDSQSRKPELGRIFQIYEKRCFQAGAMDFDDLLYKTNILFRDFKEVLLKYQDKFRYILVDEYQDTNFSQYLILKKLAARFENICVVGDDAQSIYSFRGANIQNILNFQKEYSDAQVFKLEQNYRSTQNIVNAANGLIAKNKEQLKKDVWTENTVGEKLKIIKTLSDNEEGFEVANDIFYKKANEQRANSEFAILYRTNSQSRAIEEALRKKDIPYRIYGGLSFYHRKEIKDLLAYFRLAINPKDEEALKRVINYPKRGIGKTTMDKILLAANANEVSVLDVVHNPMQFGVQLSSAVITKLKSFSDLIDSYHKIIDKGDAFNVASKIASSSGILKELYVDKSVEGVARYDNIQEILSGIKEFTEQDTIEDGIDLPEGNDKRTLDIYMQDIALLTDTDKNKGDSNVVSLMTIHASKGLEFPYVYIVGMEENLFPSQLSINSRTELEEERRLFYVALTRAETKATLSYSTTRYRWGNLTYAEPSRFLQELDVRYIDQAVEKRGRSDFEFNYSPKPSTSGLNQKPNPSFINKTRNLKKVATAQPTDPNFQAADLSNLKKGDRVLHQRFGKGEVIKLEGSSGNLKATVEFDQVGSKNLLLKFAKLQIL
ncbi:MAG: ATP-dependent DNA helicase [Crocinitomicaceae bacterium]|nr:ATP-dependent DNA helicase [Crocinitomicaceae bacterium]|tara:strand:+ start:3761 stop:6064 length:2304 start_codon:yes stop_codon:yes gene_type:complete